jgi:UPF0755 protein
MEPQAAPQKDSPRRGRAGRRVVVAGVGLALLLAGVEVGRALLPAPGLRTGPRTVEILPQSGLLQVARTLAEAEVIRSRAMFVLLAVFRGTAGSLKAGEYELPEGAPLLAVLRQIELGRVKPRLLVLPEGFTIRELARQIEAEGIAPGDEVRRVATNPIFAWSLGLAAETVEGYLFPDTYQVTKGMRIEEILARMVQRFREKVATDETLTRLQAHGLSLHELVTLASIVEKEAVLAEERPVIAGVFWNRLRRDMPLQADPTVAYAVGKDGRAPTRDDLQVDHPFNTYRNRGLPPGPIANPGLAAIQAVLSPAKVPYLYFVSIDDRQHHFSTTLEEHQQAVLRYRQAKTRARAL